MARHSPSGCSTGRLSGLKPGNFREHTPILLAKSAGLRCQAFIPDQAGEWQWNLDLASRFQNQADILEPGIKSKARRIVTAV